MGGGRGAEAAIVSPMTELKQDWSRIGAELDEQGWALLPALLEPAACAATAMLYDWDDGFRSRVVMARHGFGRGEYRYFSYPLPRLVESLLGKSARFPGSHADYIAHCHEAGQTRPTPLLLRYGPGDYNCLHQDLYGEEVFPLQVAILLSEPGKDFTGGEFALTEQRPRMQSRVMVAPLRKGDGICFAVNNRPVKGTRGTYQVKMRHGVSRLATGQRHTLGIIFHDAS